MASVDRNDVTSPAVIRSLGVYSVFACVALPAVGGSTSIATASPASVASPTPFPQSDTGDTSDPCEGQDTLLATLDRPTTGYSVCAVPKGAFLIEEGYQTMFQGGRSPNVTVVYPQGFERIGVADRFEVDVIGPNFNRMRAGASLMTGYSDSGLGFKYQPPHGGHFSYAFDVLFTAATGTGAFSDGAASETLNADVSYALSPAIDIATTLAGMNTASGERYGSFQPSVVVTAQIPHDYQFFAEFVGVTKIAARGAGRTFTDFGVQKLLGRNFEVDTEYGIDFTPVEGSRFDRLGAGFGLRLL